MEDPFHISKDRLRIVKSKVGNEIAGCLLDSGEMLATMHINGGY